MAQRNICVHISRNVLYECLRRICIQTIDSFHNKRLINE